MKALSCLANRFNKFSIPKFNFEILNHLRKKTFLPGLKPELLKLYESLYVYFFCYDLAVKQVDDPVCKTRIIWGVSNHDDGGTGGIQLA